jgi:MioC protein
VADALSDKLIESGHQAQIHLEPNLDDIDQSSVWLICSSTHGAGDLPDNILTFAKQIQNIDLSSVLFTVVGLGDSSYDTYCFGAMTLERLMSEASAKKITPVIHIDVLHHPIPEEPAVDWLNEWLTESSF